MFGKAIENTQRVENIVASVRVAEDFDLYSVAEILSGSEYEPERFPGLIYRLRDPKTAILLFRSGKANCTGGKNLDDVRKSVRKVARLLDKAGITVDLDPEITVQNMVAVYDIGCTLNLVNLIMSVGTEHIEYEQEQIPGHVYRVKDPNAVCLLFGSGKMVITGAKSDRDIERTVDKVVRVIRDLGVH